MLQAVIFDMDGVLIDSEPFHYEIENVIFGKLNIHISPQIRKTFVGMANRKMWSTIKDNFNLQLTLPELLEFDRNIREGHFSSLSNLSPMPGAEELLRELKKERLKIALASSSSSKIIRTFMGKLGLIEYFEHLVSGNSVEKGKPEPDIFLHTAKLLKILPQNCLVIEDSQNGVRAARGAGMKCIGLKSINSKGQNLSEADFVIRSLEELHLEQLKALF